MAPVKGDTRVTTTGAPGTALGRAEPGEVDRMVPVVWRGNAVGTMTEPGWSEPGWSKAEPPWIPPGTVSEPLMSAGIICSTVQEGKGAETRGS